MCPSQKNNIHVVQPVIEDYHRRSPVLPLLIPCYSISTSRSSTSVPCDLRLRLTSLSMRTQSALSFIQATFTHLNIHTRTSRIHPAGSPSVPRPSVSHPREHANNPAPRKAHGGPTRSRDSPRSRRSPRRRTVECHQTRSGTRCPVVSSKPTRRCRNRGQRRRSRSAYPFPGLRGHS